MINPRYLVISLGNPLPKYSSLHSAGHYGIRKLPSMLVGQPQFRAAQLGGELEKSLVSEGMKYTLVQSPTLMNVSGKFVAAAWRQMCSPRHGFDSLGPAGLVLVHDELERDLGRVDLVPWERSARGHNGVRDSHKFLRQEWFPACPFARITVGIGRPDGRDKGGVADYVLKKISDSDRRTLEEEVPPLLVQKLSELEAYWRAEVEAGSEEAGLGWTKRMRASQHNHDGRPDGPRLRDRGAQVLGR